MLDRRSARPVMAAVAALAVLGPCLPARADSGNPTPAQLKAAHQRVVDAQESVSSLQVRAEQAAEQYNGALVRAQAAEALSASAIAKSQVADAAQARAQGVATGAEALAQTAQDRATQATADEAAAQAQVTTSQNQLDQMAATAYETGGQMGVVGSLLTADDPSQLSRSQGYMDHVSAFRQSVIVSLSIARDAATLKEQESEHASAEATSTAAAAEAALTAATTASTAADTAREQAVTATATAHHALYLASKAKGRALFLVAHAQRLLGTAKQQAHRLEVAAAAARLAAQNIAIPNATGAAAIAIHWAFAEIGVPYSWGGGDANGPTYGFDQGTGIKGFDCSGLTLFAYAHAGITLQHYTGDQWTEGERISSRSDLQPGDLMFFAYNTSDPSTIHHVSIYIGNDQMIEAPYTGSVVRVSSADRSDFIGGVRPWA